MEGAPPWITTFVDMTSLLVTFFILLFTFASIQEYDSFTFKQNFLGTRGLNGPGGSDAIEPPDDDMMAAMDVARGAKVPHVRPSDELSENLDEMGRRVGPDDIEFDPKNVRDGLVVTFDARASFAPGSATVNAALRRRLADIGSVMEHYDHMIVIEGHVDSEFKATQAYPTPEALSAARASNAARVLTEVSHFPPELIQIAALGNSDPRVPGTTAQERTLNRRIEIQVLSLDRTTADARKDRGL